MSRSYRIAVRECVNRVIKAEDRISTQLEVLEVLPPEQMAGLLSDELKKRGFEEKDGVLVRKEQGIVITVEPCSGTVTVTAENAESTKVDGELTGRAYDDVGPHANQVREQLRKELQRNLEKKVEEKAGELQGKVTDKLEGTLGDLRQELDEVVNRVTADALERKAASLGQIKEMTEDPQSGSLTIVVEV